MLITWEDRKRSKTLMQMWKLRRLEMMRNLFLLFEENIPKSITGLPYDIWLDKAGSERRVQHHVPRLKVRVDKDNLIPVSIESDPKVYAGRKIDKFKEISNFIKSNKNILMRYWNREIEHDDLIDFFIKNKR